MDIPIIIKINDIVHVNIGVVSLFSICMLSGIKSVIDRQIIMPEANARHFAINLFSFFMGYIMGSRPIIVDSPANMVRKKAMFVSFIIITNIIYELIYSFIFLHYF